MILTAGQEQALKMCQGLTEFNSKPKIAVLAGYAGTGKSTTLKALIQAWGGTPTLLAPTGKAAARVTEITGARARTVHSWIYNAEEDEQTGEVTYSLKSVPDVEVNDVPVVVIDEASMVGQDLWEDVYEMATITGQNLLVVGDPGQLPPVQKGERNSRGIEFNLLSEHFCCDVRTVLTEIVRQARDNPIIQASMLIRDGDVAQAVFQLPRIPVREFVAEAAAVIRRGGVVLCHKNETRHRLNTAIRAHLGLPPGELTAGEPLLVLQNSHRLQRFNGEFVHFQGWVEEPGGDHLIKDWIRKQEARSKYGIAQLEKTGDDQYAQVVLALSQVWGQLDHLAIPPIVKTGRNVLALGDIPEPSELWGLTKDQLNAALGPPHLHANLGYAMTIHKFQGSEAPEVLVCVEPSARVGTPEGQRWLYTAVTRSSRTVKLCLGTGLPPA